ncbi:MAG TPA: DUF2867 domain-containing protein [Acidimicrobiaceae bacterium]|nr:DUF2867 domain-containing protein [Acidimicrobiaceae bacterium]
MARNDAPIVVTGATGYVGGRLIPRLLAAGYSVRCVARRPEELSDRLWKDQVEIVQADLSRPEEIPRALDGAKAAYYLLHSMSSSNDFAKVESSMAQEFAIAAEAQNLDQIVYLGGLGHDGNDKSDHLSSRHRVGRLLASGETPVTELRAAVIIGSGSASFEMLRSLVEVLPFMVVPKWVSQTLCQPVAISDVLDDLVFVLNRPEFYDRTIDIGGPDVVTYQDMMHAYANVAGLRRRWILPVPVLTPRLSSHWVNLVSPLPIQLARPLIDSLTSDVVVADGGEGCVRGAPNQSLEESIGYAVSSVQGQELPTRWSNDRAPGDELGAAMPDPSDPFWAGGRMFVDQRGLVADSDVDSVMAVVRSLGGSTGWLVFDWLWAVRGFVDKLLGGVGLRRGRRHPTELRVGDSVDFFEVVEVTPNSLRLRAEMKVPGHAWLEWQAHPKESGCSVEQRAVFVPRGLWGRVYWLSLVPAHAVIFKRMLRAISDRAEKLSTMPVGGSEK